MTGRIHAGSVDVYEDQARALFDYYHSVASQIVQQEMSLEQAVRSAEEELIQIQQTLKSATTRALIFLGVGCAVCLLGWLGHWVVSVAGLLPVGVGAFLLHSAKGVAATETSAKHRQLQGFQDAHRAIRRDFKVHKLGVVYVPVASRIPFEGGSILVDHSGSVQRKGFTLATLRNPEELKGSVARIEASLNTVPLVERSANVEQVDTAEYSTSVQQVSLYDYLGGMDRDMRSVSYLLGDVDRVSVSLSIIPPEGPESEFLFRHGTTELGDAPEVQVFDTGADDANLQTFQALNDLKKSLEGQSGEYVAFFRKLMRQLGETTQLLTQMKASSSGKMIDSANRAFVNVLQASFNHYSPVLEAEEIERIRMASFDFQESIEDYRPFNLNRSSAVRYDLASRNWVAEDGSRTSFPFGMHQIHEEVITPVIQTLMAETRVERLQVYNHIKDQKLDYLNQWHRDTEDFYGRNRAESGDLMNRMRETFAEYSAALSTFKALQETADQMKSSGSLDDAAVDSKSNQGETLAAFELQARQFQEQQEEFSSYMERLKEDIDRRAGGFGRIEFFDASLRDGETRSIARSATDQHDLDPRRKPLLAAGAHFARMAELPPEPSVEARAHEDFAINLVRSATDALAELDAEAEPVEPDVPAVAAAEEAPEGPEGTEEGGGDPR
ncbi:MAG: hypothetical protein SGI92_25300 [Bryobacteraceae bacterium]|nr:hypothetical protein [Bryobacteraceae bacterium]